MSADLSELEKGVVEGDLEKTVGLTKEMLEKGVEPWEIVEQLRHALQIVGKEYETGSFFLTELVLAGMAAKEVMDVLKPVLARGKKKFLAKVVLCTVEGDIHDIGKTIVGAVFTGAGFDVIDLGVDVPAAKVVETVRKENPDVVALSALLTSTMVNQEKVINELKKAGLRDRVIVIIGGAPIDQEFARRIGADAYADDPIEGARKIERLL